MTYLNSRLLLILSRLVLPSLFATNTCLSYIYEIKINLSCIWTVGVAAERNDSPGMCSQAETCWWLLVRVDPNQVLVPNPNFLRDARAESNLGNVCKRARWIPSWGPGPLLELTIFTFGESLWNIQCFCVFVFALGNSSVSAFLHLLPTIAQQVWMGP